MEDIRPLVVGEHPYLLISAAPRPFTRTLDELKAKRTACPGVWRPLAGRIRADLETPPLFPENVRGWLWDILDATKERLLRDSLAYLFTHRKRYLQCVKDQLWSLIDHWPWIEDFNAPRGMHADLRTGVIMRTLGLVYDWLYPHLTESEKSRILTAMSEKGYAALQRDYDNDVHYFTGYGSNWLSCMLGGFGTAALATIHDLEKSGFVAELAVERCARMLEHVGLDGGWEEGPFYWGGVVNLALFFDIVRSATQGSVNYLNDERLKNTGYFPIYTAMAPNGRADFSDADYWYDHGGAAVFPLIASTDRNPHFQWAYREYRSPARETREILKLRYAGMKNIAAHRPEEETLQFVSYDPSIESQVPDKDFPLGRLFQTENYGFAVSRNGWGRRDDGVVVAAKGGNNGADHHQQDIGQLIVSAYRERYLKDLGYGNSAGFFPSGERIGYEGDFHKLTSGHNVVMIGGREQVNDASARGVIEDFRTDNEIGDSYTIDCTTAYGDVCRRGRRTVLHLRPDVLVVHDNFDLVEPEVATLRWHYDGEAEIDDLGHFVITGLRGKCIGRVVYLSGEAVEYTKGVHEQVGWISRASEALEDEYHRYVQIKARSSVRHVFISVFHFTKRRSAWQRWEFTDGACSLSSAGRRITVVENRTPVVREVADIRAERLLTVTESPGGRLLAAGSV